MIVAFDASVLMYLLDETTAAPLGEDGQPVQDCQVRVSHLIAELQRAKAKIVIPAPALAEILVYGGSAGAEWLNILNTSRRIHVSPFDVKAAVEYSVMERMRAGHLNPGQRRAKAKFDAQIVAIARMEGATTIYSDDSDVKKLWADHGQVKGIADLPLPPQDLQMRMEFDPHINDDDTPLDE
jgi:predicted nucleic acid-binding protein